MTVPAKGEFKLTDRVYPDPGVKFAVIVIFLVIVTCIDAAVPLASPDQLLNI